jgi:hypothetical protein
MRLAAALATLAALGCCASTKAQDLGGTTFLIGFGPGYTKQWDLNVRFEGDVVVRFTGRGQDGTIVWTPGQSGQMTVAEGRNGKRKAWTAFLAGNGGQYVVAHVDRGGRTCTDRATSVFDGAAVNGTSTGVELGLAGGGSNPGFDLTSTDCGGPLASDLTKALGRVPVAATELAKGNFAVDLRGGGPFASQGLSGTVQSTVIAHVGRRLRQPHEHVPRPPRQRHERELDVTYAIDSVTGSVGASFAGGELCDELASCGDTGSWLLRPGAAHGSVFATVLAPLSRPLRDLRAAAGLGGRGKPGRLEMTGGGSWSARDFTLAATTSGHPGDDCVDVLKGYGGSSLQLTRDGNSVLVAIYSEFTPGVARTRCPGPGMASDPGQQRLGTARVPLAAFARKRIRITITRGASFETDGWSGTIKPRLTIVLRRVRVRATTTPV